MSNDSMSVVDGRSPFEAVLSDTLMIDSQQANAFRALGTRRQLFGGVRKWPHVHAAMARHSALFKRKNGEQRWLAAGGVFGRDGKPSCDPMSKLATEVVGQLADDPGGLLWTDHDGRNWAVRLVPAGPRDPGTFLGFAIEWGHLDSRGVPQNGARRQLANRLDGLSFGGHAEQLLHAIHWAVMSQRRSVVVMPDILLARVVWGGRKLHWPRDWRQELFLTLRSLTNLHSEVLRVAGGWRPRLGEHSVAVAHVGQLWVTRPEEEYCRPACPMYGREVHHHHFVIQPGLGFLGVLEKFAIESPDACRTYDFSKPPDSDVGKELKKDINKGRIITISTPTALFGSAKWSGLTAAQVGIVHGLANEITRVPKKSSAALRVGKAELIEGNVVVGRFATQRLTCPILSPTRSYISFNGNGRRWRRAMGYLIVGRDNGGWLSKCGYRVPSDHHELLQVIRRFLADLRCLEQHLGLTIVGFEPKCCGWLTLENLAVMARSQRALPRLLGIHLRIYGPEDYFERLRRHYEQAGHFECIPGAEGQRADQPIPTGNLDFGMRMHMANVTQVELAAHLGVSQPFMSQLINNKKPWPPGTLAKAEEFLSSRGGSEDADHGDF